MAGYRITHSCHHCANIILDLSNKNEFGCVEIDLGVTAGAANHAAMDGCHFFQCVTYHVVEDFSWTPVKLLSTVGLRTTTEFKIINRNGFTSGVFPPKGSIRRITPRNYQWLNSCIHEQSKARLDWPTFRVYVDKDDLAFEHFRYRETFEHVPREERYFSHSMYDFVDEEYDKRLHQLTPPKHDFLAEESHRQALSWLRNCRDNHEYCKANLDMDCPRPKRLLKILPSSDRVILISDSAAPYAALSYCWGGPQQSTLTKSTLRNLEAGINTTLLSPSVQDAIKVTRSLQLSHLWVDALCIIQDDDDDKATEIQNMAFIYYFADITIAGGNAWSAREGFLANSVPYASFAVSVRMPHGSLGRILLQPGFTNYNPHALYQLETLPPLHRRGWTLQEMIFSRRYLHFGPNVLEYDCCVGDVTEGGTLCSSLRALKRKDLLVFMKYIQNPGEMDEDYSKEEILEAWWEVVKIYTGRQLTQPQDKLNGLASLADLIGTLTNLDYVAGLWTGYDFLWSLVSTRSTLPRPAYRGPSWSWVSIESQVGLAIRYPPQVKENQNIKERCSIEIIGGEVEEMSENAPFGAIKSAHLIVRAPMKLVSEYHVDREEWKIEIRDSRWGYEFQCELDAQDWDLPVSGTSVSLDEVWLMRIVTAPRSMEQFTEQEKMMAESPYAYFPPQSGALVLLKPRGSSTFLRRACLLYDASGKYLWEDSFTLKTVTIV